DAGICEQQLAKAKTRAAGPLARPIGPTLQWRSHTPRDFTAMHRFLSPGVQQLRRACLALTAALLAPSLLVGTAVADSTRAERAALHQISAERLQRLSSAMQAEVENGKLAGIATLVYQGDKVIHRHHAGLQNREND